MNYINLYALSGPPLRASDAHVDEEDRPRGQFDPAAAPAVLAVHVLPAGKRYDHQVQSVVHDV